MKKLGDVWVEASNQLGIITAVYLVPPDAPDGRWLRFFFQWERETFDGFTTEYLRVLDVWNSCDNLVDNSQNFVEKNWNAKISTIHDDISTRIPHQNPLKELRYYIKKQQNDDLSTIPQG